MEDQKKALLQEAAKANAQVVAALDGVRAAVLIILTEDRQLVIAHEAPRKAIAASMARYAADSLYRPELPANAQIQNIDDLLATVPEADREEFEASLRRMLANGGDPGIRRVMGLTPGRARVCAMCEGGPLRRLNLNEGYQNPEHEPTDDHECVDCGALYHSEQAPSDA